MPAVPLYSGYDYRHRLRVLLYDEMCRPKEEEPDYSRLNRDDFDARFDAFDADPANDSIEIRLNDDQALNDLLVVILAYVPIAERRESRAA